MKDKQRQILTDIMSEDAKDGLYKQNPFNIALVRDMMDSYDLGEISFSKMVEMLNDIAIEWHEKNK
jgi:hypothetical protein